MGARYEDTLKEKMLAITADTLAVGAGIAKLWRRARFVDFRGLEHGKALKFNNRKDGFESFLARIRDLCRKEGFARAVVGMEPTAYATKQAKELDDNSQTKRDRKDALTIARLAKDGPCEPASVSDGGLQAWLSCAIHAARHFRGAQGAALAGRSSFNSRKLSLRRMQSPRLWTSIFRKLAEVFGAPLDSKAARQIMKACPFPCDIVALGEEQGELQLRKRRASCPALCGTS